MVKLHMNILAIDTSCDETAAAVVQNTKILSNIVWTQASLHASFGGVMPSLAQREHKERIGFVVESAVKKSGLTMDDIDAVAVTIGPGLAVALEVGIKYAQEIASKHKKPLIPINHIEAHLLSPLAVSKKQKVNDLHNLFPAFGLVLSGGNTLLCIAYEIGKYEALARTSDDALGEALDKSARLLGFGYPGAPMLEKMAKLGDPKKFKLPIPLVDDKIRNRFSYSGLKAAFVRLFNSLTDPNKEDLSHLAAAFQSTAFDHVTRVTDYQINSNNNLNIKNMLLGGGVVNNVELRKRLRRLCKKHGIKLHVPYTKTLMGDNAGMIGVCAYLKNINEDLNKYRDYKNIDRTPKLTI